jgi:oligopeptide/dipeptide ABC transporter ATP-binding protein
VRPETEVDGARASVLEARGLRVTFEQRRGSPVARAVDDVNLALGPAEVVALIGESGCGKSTLARALVGLIKPAGGEIITRGTPLGYSQSALKAHRRTVQLVLQDPAGALNPRQTVYDLVAEGPRLHGMKRDLHNRVHTALTQAGLRPPEQFMARYPHELSGGQQQRVVIAGALALEPSVIVADEPVSSLDASARGEVLRLILELRDTLGLSALVVSHDLGLAWNIADRVAVMYLGRIVELGTVDQVLLHPQHPYTQALLSILPGLGSAAGRTLLTGETPDPTSIPLGCRFHPRCPRLAGLDVGDPRAALCRGEDLSVLPSFSHDALVACHLVKPKAADIEDMVRP